MQWNWQHPDWPRFRYRPDAFAAREAEFLRGSGVAVGAASHLPEDERLTVILDLIGTEALKSAGQVVLPAHSDGHAPGLERIQDLGIGAMTDAQMKSFFDKMVKAGVIKPTVDYKKSYTLQFVNKGVGINLRPKT